MTGRASVKAAALLAAVVLAGCGGGGSDEPGVTAKAEGAYAGTLNNSSSPTFHAVVLNNDELWLFYGAPLGNAFDIAGVVQGQGLSSGGSFRSTVARDFDKGAAAADVNVSGTYVPDASFSGSIVTPVGTASFTGAPTPTATYDYDTAATLAAVSGAWSLKDLDDVVTAVSINATTGAIASTNTTGCQVAAGSSLTPRTGGKNVFNLTLKFGAAPCTLAGLTVSGVALVETLAGNGKQLILAGVVSSRESGTVLTGTR